jgi:transposase-like protein
MFMSSRPGREFSTVCPFGPTEDAEVAEALAHLGDGMDVHRNARLTPVGREIMVRRVVGAGEAAKDVAVAMGVCEKTVRRWVRRYLGEGASGLRDRSSRPHQLRAPTPVETGRIFPLRTCARRADSLGLPGQRITIVR